MQRRSFERDGLTLSYIDYDGAGRPLIALHAYWMEAGTWAALAKALAPDFTVFALDQRGHGYSDKPDDLSWDAYIGDLEAFLDHLGLGGPVPLIGNSLGGTVAFRYAARHPERVSAMMIEEAPAVESGDVDFIRSWSGVHPTREALEAAIGERFAWSVEPSFRQTDEGWTLAFSPDQLADAQAGLTGDFWSDWLATRQPALLMRGSQSRAVDGALLAEMAKRRPNTVLETFGAGHVIHHEKPQAFARSVRRFLTRTLR